MIPETLRTTLIVLPHGPDRRFADVAPWLEENVPDRPCYLIQVSPSHIYMMFSANGSSFPSTSPLDGEVRQFSTPVEAERWITEDVRFRHAPAMGTIQ